MDFSLLLGASDIKDVLTKRSVNSPETSPSPEKMRKTTSLPDDEPSTSFVAFKCKIKEEPPPDVPEESFEGQKRDHCNESSDSIAGVRSKRKRLKVERGIKKETEDPSLTTTKQKTKKKKKNKEEDEEEEESYLMAGKVQKQELEDRYVNQLVGGMDAEESFLESVSDSDAEDDVSSDMCRYSSICSGQR